MFERLFGRRLTLERFAQRFQQQLARSTGFVDVRYDASKQQILYTSPSGQRGVSYLANAYTDACKAPRAEVDTVISKYILAIVEGNRESKLVDELDRLMPVVRDRAYFGLAELTLKTSELTTTADPAEEVDRVPWRPLAGDYGIAVAIDSENAIAPVGARRLQGANLTLDQALSRGIENLRGRTDSKFSPIGDGVFLSGWQDVYDASRVLLPELLHQLPLRGAPVVSLPSRNHLLVTGDRDVQGLARVIALSVQIVEEETRPMPPALLTIVDGQWRTFAAAGVDEGPLRALCRRMRQRDYQEQGKLLEALHQKNDIDVFVSTPLWISGKDATEAFTASTWSKGVDTLLAEADRLVLYIPESKEVISVSWSDMLPILGHRLVDQGLFPPRHRVESFPDESELAKVRSLAIEVQRAR